MRAYIRHPIDVPINYETDETPAPVRALKDVSHGGLCFITDRCLPEGTRIKLEIPHLKHPFREECLVVWCREKNGQHEIGVKFTNKASAFRARMIEQVCYIESYKRKREKESGRPLEWKTAAAEWIKNYGARFPEIKMDDDSP